MTSSASISPAGHLFLAWPRSYGVYRTCTRHVCQLVSESLTKILSKSGDDRSSWRKFLHERAASEISPHHSVFEQVFTGGCKMNGK